MSTQGRICHDREAPVVTNEAGRKRKFCRDKGSSVMTLIIATWKSLLRQKKGFRERPLPRQGNVCRNTEIRSICCNKVMYIVMPKEEENVVMIDKQGSDM